MKVRELIEALEELPDDLELIVQADPEGNDYRPLRGADAECIYVEEDRSVLSIDDGADGNCMDEEEWEELLKSPRCVVLFP